MFLHANTISIFIWIVLNKSDWSLNYFRTSMYLEALYSPFKKHEEGGVWVDGLPSLKNIFGLQ